MKSPYLVTVVSREEMLAAAARLVSQAEAEMEAAWLVIKNDAKMEEGPSERAFQLSEKAFFSYHQALSLFEKAGDLADPKFKAQLAEHWMRCSTIVGRLAWNGPDAGKVVLGFEALHYSAYERGVRLHGELIASELRSDKQLRTAWAQIIYLHNLAMWAMRMGSLRESERLWCEHIELLKRFDEANSKGVHNPRDWLLAHFHLAFLRQMLGCSDKKVLATIDLGLAGFEPGKCVSPTGLEYCHYLTQLKSEILRARWMKNWERSQQRKERRDSKAKRTNVVKLISEKSGASGA